MPQGTGTYGNRMGRPKKKTASKKKTAKNGASSVSNADVRRSRAASSVSNKDVAMKKKARKKVARKK